jgi:hypothetical protein
LSLLLNKKLRKIVLVVGHVEIVEKSGDRDRIIFSGFEKVVENV